MVFENTKWVENPGSGAVAKIYTGRRAIEFEQIFRELGLEKDISFSVVLDQGLAREIAQNNGLEITPEGFRLREDRWKLPEYDRGEQIAAFQWVKQEGRKSPGGSRPFRMVASSLNAVQADKLWGDIGAPNGTAIQAQITPHLLDDLRKNGVELTFEEPEKKEKRWTTVVTTPSDNQAASFIRK